ncbi:DNA helicase INO80 [Kwoniella heveanensis CBS 569]|nr:DNA helicase INO80 [Kwoniella heveanensis CBS 569]
MSISPPRPTPASRMALSALVNSPPASPPRPTRSVYDPHPTASPSAAPAASYPSSSSTTTRYQPSYAGGTAAYYDNIYDQYETGFGSRPAPRDFPKSTSDRERIPAVSLSATARYDGNGIGPSSNYRNEYEDDYPPRRVVPSIPSQNGVPEDRYRYPEEYDRRSSASTSPQKHLTSLHPQSRYVSPPEIYHPQVNGANGDLDLHRRQVSRSPSIPRPVAVPSSTRVVRPDDRLIGNEDIWADGLKRYQVRREDEVEEISKWAEKYRPSGGKKGAKKSVFSDEPLNLPQMPGQSLDDDVMSTKSGSKTKSSGKDAPVKRKYAKKNKKKPAAGDIDDELLGLVGDEIPSSPALAPSVAPAVGSDGVDPDEPEGDPFDPDAIVRPCGLTRAEVIRKIEANDISGLTEDDVKAVQDEMWLRDKGRDGGAPVNKDGTVRKKPGPAKGWKRIRGIESKRGRKSGAGGEYEGSDAGDTSIADETVNGEADADIAALLGEDGLPPPPATGSTSKKGKAKAKRRKIDELTEETTKFAELSDVEDHKPSDILIGEELDEDRSTRAPSIGGSSVIDGPAASSTTTVPAPPKKKSKAKEPGVGKGRWTRPPKAEKDGQTAKKADGATKSSKAVKQVVDESPAAADEDAEKQLLQAQVPQVLADDPLAASANATAMLDLPFPNEPVVVEPEKPAGAPPNSYDPRGISEAEAQVRFSLVEDYQKQVWSSIVRDVPKIYRVYQGYDSMAKQSASRKAQAAVRNGHGQRNLKSLQKSGNRINKDAVSKGKRIVKEMLVFWKKNEKDELLARKKAEKEALEKAKAEEEARESKRQARKLNFLLTQTELYSHFIGKKIKTHEAEQAEGMEKAPEEPKHPDAELGLGDDGEVLPDIDYDDDDEANLRRHAARGAHAAVQAAKDKAAAFDASTAQRGAVEDDTMDGDELNFQNPSLGEDSITITQPKMLMAQLKEYQLKGLTWLGNLYEQGINGILADEMGLGKTIQSISLLAYLAEHHNLWGPFLVIAPSSTLHNWQQELARFVPRLKALPYWGSPKDRETLRRIWSRKNQTFHEGSPFHILVTSYQLAVQDEKYLQGMKWQYMILDEAQAIKSSSSARWKSLLSLHCRNRLLLTGTPIQNSMHELWALLHFIMPSLFDSHEEFSEWFSKDIENAAGGQAGSLKPEQLRRLHMILKPFMLRRVKKHVQKELGDKIEIDLLVDLSQRQRSIYKALRQRVSIADLIAQANNITDTSGAKNLMNLVMQFRKVCNHPDLFERADVVSPYMFGTFSQSGNLAREGDSLYLPDSAKNAIEVNIPKILWTDGGKLNVPSEKSLAGSDTHVLRNLMNIWSTDWINERTKQDKSEFGFVKFLDNASPAEVSRSAKSHPLVSLLNDSDRTKRKIVDGPYMDENEFSASSRKRYAIPPRLPHAASPGGVPLRDITQRMWNQSFFSRPEARFANDYVVAPLIKPVASNRAFLNAQERVISDPLVQEAMYGLAPSQVNDASSYARLSELFPNVPPRGLLNSGPMEQTPIPTLRVPPTKRLIVDSAKLARLDDLLRELKDGGHRVLLYFQMTKMMDLVEEYLIFRQYKYLRLDGSSAIGDRRDMVTSWQTNPDIFVFCLSTRAGGLGINLTAADTVVFYDHDWNPSSDAQAMDRAHRVGQTKQVTVYRLIARGTIEERILKMARAKKDVQDIVVGTKSLTDVAKPSEIVSLFMDDEELAESVAKRKQAEAHGYVAPAINNRPKSAFGDGLGNGADDDEDDFFRMQNKGTGNNEDEDFGDEDKPAGVSGGGGGGGIAGEGASGVNGGSKKKSGGGGSSKRKAAPEGEKKPQKKKVKIALGPDGLPI